MLKQHLRASLRSSPAINKLEITKPFTLVEDKYPFRSCPLALCYTQVKKFVKVVLAFIEFVSS